MNNTVVKYAIIVALIAFILLIVIKLIPLIIFAITVVIIVGLVYCFVEVNAGRKTPDELKTMAQSKLNFLTQWIRTIKF